MQKHYQFALSGTQKTVSVNGQPLPLKRRSSEPEGFTSPDRIALSILADCVGDDAASLHSHDFQKEIVDHCEAGEGISSDVITEWNNSMCRLGASVQAACCTADATEPPAVGGTCSRLPRLLRVRAQAL